MTEGTITRWMKSVGEQVAVDEPLFEVSTDKVDTEVPSPASGVLSEILVPEGDTVDVGVRLAVISEATTGVGAPTAAVDPTTQRSPSAQVPPPPAPPFVPPPPPPPVPPPPPAAPPTPAVESPTPVTPGVSPFPPPGSEGARILSPVVRRLLTDNGIHPDEVNATGLGGRITREDVLAVIDARKVRESGGNPDPWVNAVNPPPPPPPPASAPPSPVPSGTVALSNTPSVSATPSAVPRVAPAIESWPAATDNVVPFSNMRRRTAEHMVRSKATSPHAFIANEVDFESVERVRRAWGERFRAEEGFSLTYLPFVARASVEALRSFPNLNASVGEDSLIVHQEVNLGIAVDLGHEGLIVPVIHRAEEVTLRGIARRIRDLANRARTRQLTADDISGGTFSITNDGPFGTYFTVPIINQPQVGILATDGIKRRPVVVELPDGTESIGIHSTGLLGMSWDHRAVDGAYVSSYLARVGELIASRDWEAEL